MRNNSSIMIKDIDSVIEAMCPVKIYINESLAWDDDVDNLDIYDDILTKEDIIINIYFEIVQFHHSIVYITTL